MNNKTDIEEEIKQYKELKKNKFIIASIEPDYFFSFAENILVDRKEKEQYIKQIADMLNIADDQIPIELGVQLAKANKYDSLVEKIKKDIEEYPEATYTKYYLLDCLELLRGE